MNELFLKRMHEMLGDKEYEEYLKTLDLPLYKGLRVNLLKDETKLLEDTFKLTKSVYSGEGYYIDEDISGNHPYHLEGLFYMQEVSATSVVEISDIKEGEWVLDLCAAPGGKSSQIASKLNNTGFLVSNEIIPNRANILLSNMERMGASANMITNTSPDIICSEMAGCFDKVVVDAPCSGEGMFKKHDQATSEWSEEHVVSCANRQGIILDEAYKALKQDGILIYSTCTYSMEENEMCIYEFLQRHPDMELLDCNKEFGRSGYPYKDLDVSKVRRILPMDKGEGHFIAKMIKRDQTKRAKLKELSNNASDVAVKFLRDNLSETLPYLYENNNKVYMKDSPFIKLKKTKILRQGIMCGEIVKNRFEPHHHLYLSAINNNRFKNSISLNNDEVITYLSGNIINRESPKGYVALKCANHIIGFGKSDGRTIKNKYPKGLRCNTKF